MKAIDNLKEYIEIDEIYQDYKKGIEPSHNDGNTDFEWFCINHCRDIEKVLNKIERQKDKIEFLKWDNNDKKGIENNYLELLERVNKAIEYIKQLEHSDWVCFGRDILLDILEDK